MRHRLSHDIDNNPQAEDAGTITVTANIFGEDDITKTFTTLSLAKDFIDDENDECTSKEDLNYFLLEAGISDDVTADALMGLICYVDGVTCPASNQYSPRCALKVQLDLIPDYFNEDDDSQSLIQEAVQISFDETNNIRFRPASKLVLKSLTRKIYNKNIKKEKKKKKKQKMISSDECTICLQDFSNGGIVVHLPCGHVFDDECIVKWFETSHVCPLCRLQLPCEDQ